ncbi:NADH-quinone oxidoreductase subunit C [Streptomyces sp. enrichment culture]|uniref:NADH-quinone oxidoreductase subunit C n=1 Tax=Streptomyces sp. enrichment culture TaxID=1795815 RepID=UPI003F572630
MTTAGWLPAPAEELFGPDATAEESYDVLTVDVPPTAWLSALRTARDELGCTYFDWLSAVDEGGTGFRVCAHVVALAPVHRLLVRTTVPPEAPTLPTAVDLYAGAAWHERETHEMFGVTFEGHPGLDHLLLPETFEGHPLRKDFVLAARVAKAWPGAKEPGESDHGGPKRRQMLPPGVPDPNDWGPLKGQLPPAPTRPARGTARPAGERPPRRTRTASEGSASQTPATAAPAPGQEPPAPTAGPRRARTASQGSASQRTQAPAASSPETGAQPEGTPPTPPAGPRRARSASQGSASQRAAAAATPAAQQPTPAEPRPAEPRPAPAPRSPDAPWHHARPAFDETEATEPPASKRPAAKPPAAQEPAPEAVSSDDPARRDEAVGSDAPARGDEAVGSDDPAIPDNPPTPEDPAGGPQ